MKNIWLFAVVTAIAMSCGNETTVSDKTIDSMPDSVAVSDTIKLSDTISFNAIASTMGGDTITPADRSQIFYAFTVKLSDNKHKPISGKEARKRFLPLDPNCEGEAAFIVRKFFEIDSLKRIDEEPDNDIGMVVFAQIKIVDTIRKTPNGCWVAWTIDYSTSGACPFASGTYFMISTYDKSGKNISTQCMGCEAGGADAPISWTKQHETNIFIDGSFRGLLADTTEDYDVNDKPVYSVYRKTFTGQIDSVGRITYNEKDIERTE